MKSSVGMKFEEYNHFSTSIFLEGLNYPKNKLINILNYEPR